MNPTISTILNWLDEVVVLYECDESVNPPKAQMTLIWSKPGFDLNWPELESGDPAKWPPNREKWTKHPWTVAPFWTKTMSYDSEIVTILTTKVESA